MIVCLDAGHGKSTAGKRSFDESFFEYEFNRDVVNRIQNHLIRHGVQVVLTAPSDIDTSLDDRCKISDIAKSDVFVSIHANANGDDWNDANGWEVYSHTGSAKGLRLAEAIHAESIPYLGLKDRGLKTSDFYVLKHTEAPAVLIEHGFYSNKSELDLLKSAEFREKCAIADSKGILKYLGVEWQEDYKALYESAQMKLDQIERILKGETI
jgi:N-acetylmuramoyl-L-alanine amidase